ncbi:hypothetical protein Hypma_006934 [Hypsizygus marmoreus]|uniref:Uncharacterized protein n=1 Tax=Hypsizygus marmoreus TaxID=39966 RepID=A0A369JY65_HYPMA|nr:hypothetical protein Hypma_006934 [Hypsizygus marmoreus]
MYKSNCTGCYPYQNQAPPPQYAQVLPPPPLPHHAQQGFHPHPHAPHQGYPVHQGHPPPQQYAAGAAPPPPQQYAAGAPPPPPQQYAAGAPPGYLSAQSMYQSYNGQPGYYMQQPQYNYGFPQGPGFTGYTGHSYVPAPGPGGFPPQHSAQQGPPVQQGPSGAHDNQGGPSGPHHVGAPEPAASSTKGV